MATPPNEIVAEMADRFGIREEDAHFLLMFGDHQPDDGDEVPFPNDPTLEEVKAWHEQTKAAHDALHWTAAGITRNVKSVLSRRGDRALKPNEAASLRAFLAKVAVWDSSGVLQRATDFIAGLRAAGAGEIISNAPSGVVANLLSALDPALLAKRTLERLREDLDGERLPVPRRLQDALDELDNDNDEYEAMMQETRIIGGFSPTTTRH